MPMNLTNKVKKIIDEFSGINKLSKLIIIYGIKISLILLIIGLVMLIANNIMDLQNIYLKVTATEIVRSGFNILAESIIGGIIIDFISQR